MKLRLEYPKIEDMPSINYSDSIYLTGSCFSENIANRLLRHGFNTDANSHGIIYNPVSVFNGLIDLIHRKEYTEKDLEEEGGKWVSFHHHGAFSSTDKLALLDHINNEIKQHSERLKAANHLFITLGTSWVYETKKAGSVVANCHKLPAQIFSKKILYASQIRDKCTEFLDELKKINPNINIYLTISPVKHVRDGIHENQLSKSILFVAIHEIMQQHKELFYFPSYELVIDDLRDYRFFKPDMAHPNELAIDYVWERFQDSFFNPETRRIVSEVYKFRQLESHKPLIKENEDAHQQLVTNARMGLLKKYPYLSLHKS